MERIQRQLAEAEEAEKPKGGATEVVDKPRQLSDEVLAGIEAGNINIDGSAGERMSLSESGSEVRDNKQQLREVFDRRKRARSIAIPTEDYKVKALLREYGEPVCLFGEGPADRRARVTDLVADKGELQKPGEARAGTEDAGEEQVGRDGLMLLPRRACACDGLGPGFHVPLTGTAHSFARIASLLRRRKCGTMKVPNRWLPPASG